MVAQWYALKVYSGCEKRVLQEVRNVLAENDLQDSLHEFEIPTFEAESIRNGKRVVRKKLFFSGYVFLRLDFSDKVWYLVQCIERVIGFAGTRRGVPRPISDKEAENMLDSIRCKAQSVEEFCVGESVKVKEGPFVSMQGVVREVDLQKRRLKIVVTIFGRAAPVDLDFAGVEKI